ncbi:MAG TPA: sigma-70 family RNA polymerase sigma factor [Phycisphaerae bacterium]|nr:sigma-70 family RNA polymerase sigma factor [Phycisphaerae bacterium]
MPTPDARTDEELIAAANAGDASAFEALYQRYRDWALRLAWRFTRDHDDACDVVQDAFTYLLRKFPGFRLTARLTTFLYPAIRNVALTRRRGRGRSAADPAVLDDIPAPPIEPPDAARAELARVHMATVVLYLLV